MKNLRKHVAKMCIICKKRRAIFIIHNRCKWDKKHNLCFACYKSLKDKLHAQCIITPRPSCVLIGEYKKVVGPKYTLAGEGGESYEIQSY